jgi:hypothetical protein
VAGNRNPAPAAPEGQADHAATTIWDGCQLSVFSAATAEWAALG